MSAETFVVGATELQLAKHICGHEDFIILDDDETFERLFALLRAAQLAP